VARYRIGVDADCCQPPAVDRAGGKIDCRQKHGQRPWPKAARQIPGHGLEVDCAFGLLHTCGKQGQGIGVSAPLDPVNKFGCPLIFAKAAKRVKCACGINDKTAPAKAFRCPLKGRPCARRT
jgi:hypothetical protein